jgi:uncharacterized protein
MTASSEASRRLRGARVGLLTTYRRSGEPVATPVSIAVRDGGVYFVTPATSGKARRLTVRPDVTLAPSTVSGRATGSATEGRAQLLSRAGRWHARRLLQPGGPLFWSYLTYRIRGHRMQVYEVRFAEAGERPPSPATKPQRKSPAQVYRAVQLTARASALLFAGAQATSAMGSRAAQASRPLYVAFMAAHAVHFTVVARYAVVNGGRDLCPGGRSLTDVGGWATVAGIYTFVAGLAVTSWTTGAPRAAGRPRKSAVGHAATGLIAAMFVSVYLGQLRRSPWYAVPATAVAGAVTANVVAQRRRLRQHPAK